MIQSGFSTIICVVNVNITSVLDNVLADLALPEVFIQRSKQMFLVDKRGLLGLRPATRLEESRALIYRFYIPSVYEQGVMRRIAEASDLKMGGRGSIFAQRIGLRRGTNLVFDEEKLDRLCGRTERPPPEDYALICCTVPRGMGDALSLAVLELGVCVPVVFFGEGVGLRDKLGLLRITIPIEKEIIWFLSPRQDAELVEKTLIPRARLDVRGHGFLYKFYVHAPVINLRIRQGKRVHAATMEQVIAVLDEVQGSSDWRRLGVKKRESASSEKEGERMRGLFFIGEEEDSELFRRVAMENGARGATMNHLEMRSYIPERGQDSADPSGGFESHSRELCDIILPVNLEKKLKDPFGETGLFDKGKTCVLKSFDVEMPVPFRPR